MPPFGLGLDWVEGALNKLVRRGVHVLRRIGDNILQNAIRENFWQSCQQIPDPRSNERTPRRLVALGGARVFCYPVGS